MAVAPTESGNITVGKATLAQPYIGVTPILDSGAGLQAVINLAPEDGETAYLCGLIVTADPGDDVTATVSGLLNTTAVVFTKAPFSLNFNPPLPANGPDTEIEITTGGGQATVFAWGFSSS